ncbi:helix-turn-helix domain-containing protein [Glutamicibacter ardleyensis]|uniref:helix-turn-helix domain-containing protein n=1 Tax=Glutamicibacter ardleyensis TaxID=225894 RepID=UPI003FD55359
MDEKLSEWVSTADVAEALGVSMSKARKVIRDEGLTVFTVGSRWKIYREDLERLVMEVRARGGV